MQTNHRLVHSGLYDEGVIPVSPHHQQTRVHRRRVLHKVLLPPSNEQFPAPYAHEVLGNPVVPRSVSIDGVGGAVCANEITVVTGGADSCPVQRNLGLEQGVGDLEEGRGGGEPFQSVPQSHPEHGQDGGCFGLWGVRLSKELNWHLPIRLDDGPHGRLLSWVSDSVYIHTFVVSLWRKRDMD